MARRYAEGRLSYAPAMYNDAINRAIGCGIEFFKHPTEPLYATSGWDADSDQPVATDDNRGVAERAEDAPFEPTK